MPKVKDKLPCRPLPRVRPPRIKETLHELKKKYRAADAAAYAPPKKQPGAPRERGSVWAAAEINYLFRSALYYKPELKGPFAQDENAKALRAAAWVLIGRKCFCFISLPECNLYFSHEADRKCVTSLVQSCFG